MFEESKIVTSIYNQSFEGALDDEMIEKLQYDALDDEALEEFHEPTYINLMKSAVKYSDAIIKGSEELDPEIDEYIDAQENKPTLKYYSPEEFADAYEEFYLDQVLNEKEEA